MPSHRSVLTASPSSDRASAVPGKFWSVKVRHQDVEQGYYPQWRAVCEPGVWSCDASHFAHSARGAWAVLCPSGRLVTGVEENCTGAPEMRGVVEAVRLVPEHAVGAVVETDQLSVAAILHGGDRTHAVRLSQTMPLWVELLELLETRDVTLKWVKGHGRKSNARLAVVDDASRKAARGPVQWN